VQPGAQSAAPLEATAQNRFEISVGAVFEFDPANNRLSLKRGGRTTVFTRDK
jgi:hypothetical protein